MNPANRGTDDTYGTWLKEGGADSAQGIRQNFRGVGTLLVLKEERRSTSNKHREGELRLREWNKL